MALKLKQELEQKDLRSDDKVLRQVLARASELQGQREEAYSLEEMERIGAELGVKPEFVRQAHAEAVARATRPQRLQKYWAEKRTAIMATWWSVGWAFPLMIAAMNPGHLSGLGAVGFFAGWVIYLGGGLLLTPMQINNGQPEATQEK
jgi:hypothetical protein